MTLKYITITTQIATWISAGVVAGVASHLLIFIDGEYHMQAPTIFFNSVLTVLSVVLVQGWKKGDIWFGAKLGILLGLAYGLSLFMSIVLYRLCFHRLCKFPGPVLAKISKLWHVARLIREPNFRLLDNLHHRFGDIVRIGILFTGSVGFWAWSLIAGN